MVMHLFYEEGLMVMRNCALIAGYGCDLLKSHFF